MPKHDVIFKIPERTLGKADVMFIVKQDKKILGTLAVSNGSLVWYPTGTTYGCKMSWAKIDKLMKDNATRVEKR